MKSVLGFLKSIFKNHKSKILVMFLSASAFGLILFPWSDLSDYVSQRIYDLSGRQIYVSFSEMGLSVGSGLGLRFSDVEIDTPTAHGLKAQHLAVIPNIAGLLALNPAFKVVADGLFRGQVTVDYKEIKTKKGNRQLLLQAQADNVMLKDINSVFPLPVKIGGKANLTLQNVKIDPLLSTFPEGDLNLAIANAIIPSSTLNVGSFGELTLPSFEFGQAQFLGRILDSELLVDSLDFGKDSDAMRIRAKGRMKLNSVRGQATPEPGSYDFRISLRVRESLQKEFSLYFGLIDQYGKRSPGHVEYLVRLSGSGPYAPPSIQPLSSF